MNALVLVNIEFLDQAEMPVAYAGVLGLWVPCAVIGLLHLDL